MLMKVSDLEGRALNWAVAYCLRGDPDKKPSLLSRYYRFGSLYFINAIGPFGKREYNPQGRWDHGGPLIAAAKIESRWDDDTKEWQTTVSGSKWYNTGKSLLPSAMRTFVYEVSGMEIEIPDELCEVAPCK